MGNVYSESKFCSCVPSPVPPQVGSSNTGDGSKKCSSYHPTSGGVTVISMNHGDMRRGSGAGITYVQDLVVMQKGENKKVKDKEGESSGKVGRSKERTRSWSACGVDANSLEDSAGSHQDMDFRRLINKVERLSISDAGSKSPKKSLKNDTNSDEELPKHVLYYGWFFSPEISASIHGVVMYFFQMCIDKVPQFNRFILSACNEADIRDPLEFYKRPGKRVKPDDEIVYHITAKFLGRSPNPEYQSAVQPFRSKLFRIHLVGLVFTAKTLGVRVKLTPPQQLIFDEKDEIRTGRKLSSDIVSSSIIQNEIQDELSNSTNQISHKKGNVHCKLKPHYVKNGIVFKPIKPEPVTTSRAHITIGCAPNVKAKQTGDDLVDIVDLEGRPATGNSNFQQDFKIKHGILRQFGRHANAFVVYPDMEMIIPAEFNAFI